MAKANPYQIVEVTWQDASYSTDSLWSVSEAIDSIDQEECCISRGILLFEDENWVVVGSKQVGLKHKWIEWIPRSLLRAPGIVYLGANGPP